MPTKQKISILEAEIKKQKNIAKNLLAKQLDGNPSHIEIAEMVDAIVEAAFLRINAHYLSWSEDIPKESPRPMRRIPYSAEFVPAEPSPTVDMSDLGFAIDLDGIVLSISGDSSEFGQPAVSICMDIRDAEGHDEMTTTVPLASLAVALNELTRLAKTYYPPEDDTTIQA